MLMNYSLFSMGNTLPKEHEHGFRISVINSCWIAIESFLKECMYELIMREYNTLNIPVEFQYKVGCIGRIKSIFKSKLELKTQKQIAELGLKEKFANNVKSSSWYPALNYAAEIQRPIEKSIGQWEFLVNLYRFRNSFTHGQPIKILRSNFDSVKDEVSKEYIKSIRYLNGKGVINLDKLIQTQDIDLLLNGYTTDFIINETSKALDEIAKLFDTTMTANQWIIMRKTAS